MGPAEIVHRVREQALRSAWRGYGSGWRRFDVGDGALCALPAFARLEQQWPENLDQLTKQAAARTVAGDLRVFGRPCPAGEFSPGLWAVDPVSGQPWSTPQTYCFDVNFRHAVGRGDVKFTLELNRLQCLHPVAALAIRDRDAKAARFCLDVLRSWMDGNPPFKGVNWFSGIELAMRLVTVALVVAAVQPVLAAPERRLLRSFVAAHGYWMARYPSLHSSANNHLVAEGLGLVVAGLLAPDLPDAPAWLRHGEDILADATSGQFHLDGWGAEQSPTYTAFTLEMLALGALLLADAGRPLPATALGRMRLAGAALHACLDEGGNAPRIGDDDEGRVLACPQDREPRYAASVLAALSGVLRAPELAPPDRDPHWRDVLFSSPATGRAATDQAHFPQGGITFIRCAIAGRRMTLGLDHGPLGFLAIAAHGHADALSLWLHLDGSPVIVDSGTYLYSGGGKVREFLRGAAAHNTLTIEDASQSLTAGAFNWRHKAVARLHEYRPGPEWLVRASHDGYMRRYGVLHERAVQAAPDGFVVADRLRGSAADRPAALRFHIHPDLGIQLDNDRAVVRGEAGVLLDIKAPAGTLMELESGSATQPPWHSDRFNSLRPGQALRIATTTSALAQAMETRFRIMQPRH